MQRALERRYKMAAHGTKLSERARRRRETTVARSLQGDWEMKLIINEGGRVGHQETKHSAVQPSGARPRSACEGRR